MTESRLECEATAQTHLQASVDNVASVWVDKTVGMLRYLFKKYSYAD